MNISDMIEQVEKMKKMGLVKKEQDGVYFVTKKGIEYIKNLARQDEDYLALLVKLRLDSLIDTLLKGFFEEFANFLYEISKDLKIDMVEKMNEWDKNGTLDLLFGDNQYYVSKMVEWMKRIKESDKNGK